MTDATDQSSCGSLAMILVYSGLAVLLAAVPFGVVAAICYWRATWLAMLSAGFAATIASTAVGVALMSLGLFFDGRGRK